VVAEQTEPAKAGRSPEVSAADSRRSAPTASGRRADPSKTAFPRMASALNPSKAPCCGDRGLGAGEWAPAPAAQGNRARPASPHLKCGAEAELEETRDRELSFGGEGVAPTAELPAKKAPPQPSRRRRRRRAALEEETVRKEGRRPVPRRRHGTRRQEGPPRRLFFGALLGWDLRKAARSFGTS